MFWLNYRVTVWIHICFALGLTFLQLFGDSIDCSMDTVDKNIIDSYCWSIGTWTLGKKFTLIHAFLNQYKYFTEKQDNPEGLFFYFNFWVRFLNLIGKILWMDVIFLDSNLGQGKYVLTLPTGSNHLSSRVYNGKVYHRLYQFVPFVMISLSVLFYLPR